MSMNSTQIPLTTEKPNPIAWKQAGLAPNGAVLFRHRETGQAIYYRMQPKPIHECPAAPPPFAERQKQARTRALADHPELKRLMRAAAKKRRLSEWAERAGLKMPWCSKFAHGRIKFPDPEHVKRLQRFAGDFS